MDCVPDQCDVQGRAIKRWTKGSLGCLPSHATLYSQGSGAHARVDDAPGWKVTPEAGSGWAPGEQGWQQLLYFWKLLMPWAAEPLAGHLWQPQGGSQAHLHGDGALQPDHPCGCVPDPPRPRAAVSWLPAAISTSSWKYKGVINTCSSVVICLNGQMKIAPLVARSWFSTDDESNDLLPKAPGLRIGGTVWAPHCSNQEATFN